MVLEILVVVLGMLCLTSIYVIWNLTRKTEFLEDWVEVFTRRIQRIQNTIKTIDSTGHFEADDEVGAIFKTIKTTVEQLEDFLEGEAIDAS